MAVFSKTSLIAAINATIISGATTEDLRTSLINMVDSYQNFVQSYTTVQRNALTSVVTGTIIFNTTNERLEWYDGVNWVSTDRNATQLNAYSVTSNVKQSDMVIIANTTGGSVTLTLPTAASCIGKSYTFIKKVAANTLTVSAQSGETINGTLTQAVTSIYATVKVISDGTQWYLI
jgi:hypothetical protein